MFVFVKTIVISAVVLLVFAGSAHAETISPRRLLEVADLTALVTSPDGSSVAFRLERASVVRNTYDIFWYVQAMDGKAPPRWIADRSEEHTSELQSLMRISYAVFSLHKKH